MEDLLYCCAMDDLSETPGAAAELLSALGYQFSTWTDEETKSVKHTLYFLKEGEELEAAAALKAAAPEWESFEVRIANIACSTLKKEDWAESWKIHFKLMEISERLAIRPSWIEYKPKKGQQVLVLDPGMSFGTGQHATTKFCLKAIDKFCAEAKSPLSMLDAGCGSGILSIAAKKLGCGKVLAFDIDPEASAIARENCELNGLAASELPVETASLEGFDAKGERYGLVAANILSSALIAGKKALLALCQPGGRLILAGILEKEYGKVKAEFEALGCAELFAETEKEWRGGAFSVPE
jgi:ribosomal protein L11 methyltransferase